MAEAEVIDVEPVVDNVAGLVPARVDHGALITPAADLETIVANFDAYVALMNRLLTPADRQRIGDKDFTKRSGWRKASTAMGVSYQNLERVHDRDETGRIIRSEFTARAIAPNGRFADGYGACSIFDRCESHNMAWKSCQDGKCKHCGGRAGGCDGFRHFSKPEHDVPATAETRAKNRAAADLFGMGEVSAEEVDSKDPSTRLATWDEINLVIAAAKGAKAAGRPVGKYPVVLGVTILETFEEDGQAMERPLITSAVAADLLTKIEERLKAPDENAGAGGDPSTPDQGEVGDQGAPSAGNPPSAPAAESSPAPAPTDGIEDAVLVEEAAQAATDGALPAEPNTADTASPTPTPAESEARQAPSPAEQQGSAATPGGGDAAHEPSTSGGAVAAHADAPAASPHPLRAETSTLGEQSRYGASSRDIWPDAPTAQAARYALARVISGGLATDTKAMSSREIRYGIKACKLFASGRLQFTSIAPDGTETEIGTNVPTGEDALPGLAPAGPDDQGLDFLTELLAYHEELGL